MHRKPPASPNTNRLAVIGGGPGGYSAAFRAADLGFDVTLIEHYPMLGGVCLNVGCIPSKTLLHATAAIATALELKEQGITFESPKIEIKRLMEFKNDVITRLNSGLTKLAQQRRINVLQGTAHFHSENQLKLQDSEQIINFDKAIIACGSRNRLIAGTTNNPRIMYSSAALNITSVPKQLLIIGGGYIGIENAFIYQGLGSEVTIAEMESQLLNLCDADIAKPLIDRLTHICDAIHTQAQVTQLENNTKHISAEIKTPEGTEHKQFDAVLVAAGRLPNSDRLNLQAINLITDDNGYIMVDECMRTNLPTIYAVGDVTGSPMLAHKAAHQGKIAAEHISGKRVCFDPKAIPSVIYSNPELAWVGLTEHDARSADIDYRCALFPWQANGRALGTQQSHGLSKLIYHAQTKKLLGGAVCGANADELIAEVTLALEMDADLEDIAASIHPHPTYSETIAQTAELALGTITELYSGKQHKQ
ncbi:MAG: dihydrolipoyl dehydrogenase [Chromatiales bacterium]|nr:dihydrolipoyl dehydrogenase [Chromatiales bacterium]